MCKMAGLIFLAAIYIIYFVLRTYDIYNIYILCKDHDILYHGTMYHTPLNNTRFSIDAYNVLIASIYLHQCFYILKNIGTLCGLQ